jgi:hypothetical protein
MAVESPGMLAGLLELIAFVGHIVEAIGALEVDAALASVPV